MGIARNTVVTSVAGSASYDSFTDLTVRPTGEVEATGYPIHALFQLGNRMVHTRTQYVITLDTLAHEQEEHDRALQQAKSRIAKFLYEQLNVPGVNVTADKLEDPRPEATSGIGR